LSVSLTIAFQLGSPVGGVVSWNMPAVWACMPKAAIDKHCEAMIREEEVGPS
jgi:hypothetical protein